MKNNLFELSPLFSVRPPKSYLPNYPHGFAKHPNTTPCSSKHDPATGRQAKPYCRLYRAIPSSVFQIHDDGDFQLCKLLERQGIAFRFKTQIRHNAPHILKRRAHLFLIQFFQHFLATPLPSPAVAVSKVLFRICRLLCV